MRRRHLLAAVAASVAAPVAAERQSAVGVLMNYADSDSEGQARIGAFRRGLDDLGWKEAATFKIVVRWASTSEALKQLAAEVVGSGPDAILADRSPATAALLHETTKVPIVFAQVTDPVGQHFVASLARPGGNVTGFSDFEPSMGGKWLELLLEVAPQVRRVALACNPRTAPFAQALLPSFEAAARARKVATVSGTVSSIADLDGLIASLGSPADGGLVVAPDAFLTLNRGRLIAGAAERRVPAIFVGSAFAQAGGLMAYGNDAIDQYRRAASYVDRILKGARPGDLPVQAPVAFSLVINLRTARALGLTVPPALLARADEVIE